MYSCVNISTAGSESFETFLMKGTVGFNDQFTFKYLQTSLARMINNYHTIDKNDWLIIRSNNAGFFIELCPWIFCMKQMWWKFCVSDNNPFRLNLCLCKTFSISRRMPWEDIFWICLNYLGDVFGDSRDGKKELRWSSGERWIRQFQLWHITIHIIQI